MLSNNIRFLRQSKKLSQKQLAEKLSVKKQTISNWESGNIMPAIQKLEKIADYFGVTTDYLLDRDAPAKDSTLKIDVTGLNAKQYQLLVNLADELRKNNDT